MMVSNRIKTILVVLFGITLTGLWFYRQLFQGYLFYYRDLTYYFYPYRHFFVETVRSGQFPFWNPYIFGGYPFFATLQAGVFYPLNIILFLFPYDLAFNLSIIVHYPLAFLFLYLLGREFKMSLFAAVISGLIYAFSGFLLGVLSMPTTLAAATWMPLAILFFKRTVESDNFYVKCRNIIWTVVFITLMFLGGEPTVLAGAVFLGILYFALIAIGKGISGFIKNTILLVVTGFILLFIAAVQIIPFIELLSQSIRAGGASFAEASHWSMSPQKLMSFVIPYFFHLAVPAFSTNEWVISFYMGTYAILLAVFSFFFQKSKRVLWVLLIISFIIVLGKNTPLFFILYKFIPLFRFVRYPQKFLLFSTFILSLLAGFGFDALCKEMLKANAILMRRFMKRFARFILFLFLVFLFFFFNPDYAKIFTRFLLGDLFKEEFLLNLNWLASKNVANLAILCFLFALIWILIALFHWNKRIFIFKILIVAIIISDLFLANYGMNLSVAASKIKKVPGNIEFLMSDQDLFRVYISPAFGRARRLMVHPEIVNFEVGINDLRNVLIVNQNMPYKIQLIDGYESIPSQDAINMMFSIRSLDTIKDVKVLDLLNCKYLLSPFKFREKGFVLIRQDKMKIRMKDIFLYKNTNWLPRAYIVPGYKLVEKQEDLLRYLISNKLKPKREVVLEEDIPGFSIAQTKIGAKAEIIGYTPNKVTVNANLNNSGILYLSDHYYPGWKAYVDGVETKIYRANYMFRAVPLSSGRHQVVFSYEPWSFKIGAFISILTILGLIGFIGFSYYKQKSIK